MSLNARTESVASVSDCFIGSFGTGETDDAVSVGINKGLNNLFITPKILNPDSAIKDNEISTKRSKYVVAARKEESPPRSPGDPLKEILNKSIGRSIVSQRVNKNSRPGKARNAVSLSVKLNCRVPAELRKRSASVYGITSQSRTEAMKEFIEYRRVLLESNVNKSNSTCVTPTSAIAAQGKENAVEETGVGRLESAEMSPAAALEGQLPRRRRLFGTPLLENASQGARRLRMSKSSLVEMKTSVFDENSLNLTPITLNQSSQSCVINPSLFQSCDPDDFFMETDPS